MDALKQWFIGIVLHGLKKVWEYTLVIIALFTIYLLIFTDCGDKVINKFLFAKDVKELASDKVDKAQKELLGGIKDIGKLN